MPLTQEQINKIRAQDGLPPISSSPEPEIDRAAELEAVWGAERKSERKASRNLGEKILDFTGGKEIAQGLGQALAQGKTAKEIDKSQEDQIATQRMLLAKRKEYKAAGKDVSKIDDLLADLADEMIGTGFSAESLLNPNELTTKQVLGDALQLGTTAAGGKIAGKIAGKATQATGVLKGAAQGALTGAAAGVPLGALEGTAQGLQNDETAGEIGKDALTGGIVGGLGGAALGAVTGGIAGGVRKVAATKANRHLDAITPKVENMTSKQYEELLNKGKISPKTKTSPAKYVLSDEEIEVANKYKDILQTKDPVKNFANVANEIKRQDEEVGKFLRSNNGIFNSGELKNHILKNIEDVTDITVDDARLTAKKQQMVENFVKNLDKNDMESLWKARKAYDRQIEKAFSGSPTLQNTLKRDFRNAIQEFIADRTPDEVYKTSMKDMSKLFRLKDTLVQKANSERKLSGFAKWAKDNEDVLKVLGGISVIGTAIGGGTALVKAASD